MNTSLIRNKITIALLSIVFITLMMFSIYTLKIFERYSQQVVFFMLFFHLKQCENVIDNHYLYHNSTAFNMSEIINNLGKINESRYLTTEIIDENGNTVASSTGLPSSENKLQYKEVAEALSGLDSSQIRYDEKMANSIFDNSYFAAMPLNSNIPGKFVIRTYTSGQKIDDIIQSLMVSIISGIFIITMLATFLIHKYVQKALSPINEILRVSNELSKGNLSLKIGYNKNDEFGILASTLNNLSNRLSDKVNELSNEKQKQELMLEYMSSPVMLIDRSGIIIAINHRGRYVFHDNRNTCTIGRHNLEVLGSELFDKAIKQCFDSMSPKSIEFKYDKGTYSIFQVFINTLPASSGHSSDSVICVFNDITAIISIYEKQADFIANASHELATPLTSIKGYSETLLDGALESPGLREKFVRIIHEESDHMQILVADLLKMARLEAADYKNTIPFSIFSTEGILENIKERLENQWQHKNQTIKIEYLNAPADVHANSDWLKQVLINLTENAIKYSKENSIIRLRYEKSNDFAIFSIKDDGIGIAAESIPFIFDRFYRADKARGRNSPGGTGLGLAIAKLIIEIFGGTIKVKSKLGFGTTFYASIPLADSDDKETHQ